MNGTLHAGEGRFVLRFERRLAHPLEKVWAALTDPAELGHWFPQDVEADLRPGGTMRFTFRGAGAPPFDGEVLVYDPPRVFAYRWGPDVLRWELRPDGSGCTLTFTDTIEAQGKAARDGAGGTSAWRRWPRGWTGPSPRPPAAGRRFIPATSRGSAPTPRRSGRLGQARATVTRAQKQAPGSPGGGQPAEIVSGWRQTACRTVEGDAIMTNSSRCRALRERGTPAAGRDVRDEKGEG